MLTSLRISFSILCLFFIPLWLTTSEQKTTFIIAIKYNLLFILYSQIIIVILFYIGYENIFNLITSNNWENRAEILNVYDYRYYFRFGGLFEEPSWFSWYITYLLGIIISYEYVYKLKILNKKIIFLLLIAISFTFSISGLLSIVLLLTTRHFIHYKKMKHTVYFLFISFALVAIVLTNEHFMERLLNILSGSDGSSNVRVFGSFYRLYIILENLALGTGVGNSINGIEYYSSKYNLSTEASISSQNGFVEAFISTGLISGLLYCIPIFLMLLIKKYRVIFLTIVLVYFTTSSIYIAPMWILLGISFYLFQPSNNQITTEKSWS
nr:O-antigen ligase family protein [Providencia sp. wls1922]